MSEGSSAESGLTLRVARKETVADDVVRLVLERQAAERLPAWEPGAHLDLALGNGMIRQYSLCGDPGHPVYEIAVLREKEGRGGSAYIHDHLNEGDLVEARGPRNHFPLVNARKYIFIAGGIGITPIVPMLRAVGSADWHLVYGGRSRSSMAFRDALCERYLDAVGIYPEDEVGLLDLDSELGIPEEGTAVYCCGPEPLIEAVEDRCKAWPQGSLHIERFSPKPQSDEPSEAFEVELARSGMTLTVPADRRIVDVLWDVGIEVEVSCEEGICGTCETAVLEGIPDHRDSILTEDEKAQNDAMFVCMSRSCSPKLRLDL